MIHIENLVKKYDTLYAVSDVTFDVPRGEILGFLGPNGAGKTTTMRIVTGFLQPDSGDVFINGQSVSETPLQVKSMVGYLPETDPLYPDMTVEEYLEFIGAARGIGESALADKIQEVAKKVGIESVIKKNVEELSKGYKQRVGLAQALIHDPQVLVLDEPTTGLDPIQIREIRRLIKELGQEKTVVLSTHIMQEVEAVCDRVLIINRGKIVAEGSPSELRAQGQSQATMTLTVRGNKQNIESSFARIPGYLSFEALNGYDSDSDLHRYTLTTSHNAAEDVFRWAVEHGFVLAELTAQEASLEDMFLQLTQVGGQQETSTQEQQSQEQQSQEQQSQEQKSQEQKSQEQK